MSSQYPFIDDVYNKIIAEKMRQRMLDKQRQLEELANDKEKLAELRSSALNNCFNFNKVLIEQRKDKSFFDQPNQMIMVDRNRYKKLKAEYTKPHPYPVAVIEGQYTNVYRKYTPEELKKLPIQTIIENDVLLQPHRATPPPLIQDDHIEVEPKSERDKLCIKLTLVNGKYAISNKENESNDQEASQKMWSNFPKSY